MAKKAKKPSAGPGAARRNAAAAQARPRSRGEFALAALREVTSSNGMLFDPVALKQFLAVESFTTPDTTQLSP